jgi:hypothetical protein
MTDLNTLIDPTSGWNLTEADAVNDSGMIVGQGWSSANYEYHALLLTPVPEPSTIALLFASAACLVGYVWRRRK